MKLLDVNLLLYAYNADSPRHAVARPWLEDQLSGTETMVRSRRVDHREFALRLES